MNNIITFPRGELKRRAQEYTLLTNSVFDPDAEGLTDIQIITLSQHLREQAMDEAYDRDMTDRIDTLLSQKFHSSKEFIHITENIITVGVNAEKIDDTATNRALFLLTNIDDLTQPQRVEFGEEIRVYAPVDMAQ